MMLSEHFGLREMIVSGTDMPNIPSDAEMDNLRRLAAKMEEVRAAVGQPITVSSAFRSEQVNRAVGGSNTSDHVHGLACDFTSDFGAPTAICLAIIDAGIKFDQLIDETRTRPDGSRARWVHIGIGPRMRQQVMTAVDGIYTPGLQQRRKGNVNEQDQALA